jgi:peptidoglycan/xylan/chitin deacetylase (PgdA/CDA1 family)
MIASSALPLAAPLAPSAAPVMIGTWAAMHAAFLWSLLRSGGELYGPNIRRGETNGARVALTFDDGPGGDETQRLLDLLDAEGVRASFFVVGRRALRHAAAVRRMAAAGHTIGNHTMSHLVGWAAAGKRRAMREVTEAQEALAGITGVAPELFRPPMGHKNVYLPEILEATGLKQVTWSIRAWDTILRSEAPVAQRILRRARPGEIILLHEGLSSRGGGAGMAAGLARRLIKGLRERGLRPVSLSELLRGPAEPDPAPSSATPHASSNDEPAR